jgi:hypothetical protein
MAKKTRKWWLKLATIIGHLPTSATPSQAKRKKNMRTIIIHPAIARQMRDRIIAQGLDPSRKLADDYPKLENEQPMHGIFSGLHQLDAEIDTAIFGKPFRD